MTELIAELIISVDGAARGTRSPAYYGYYGPEFGKWLAAKSDQPHRNLMGRKTYDLLTSLPEKHRDDDYTKMAGTTGWVFSGSLEHAQWPGLQIMRSDLCEHVRQWKRDGGGEIRTVGSLSVVRQLISAELVDRLSLIICPLVLPETGIEPVFAGCPDIQFKLLGTRVLDERILVLDYKPDGPAPRT